jgi:DNA processing protein
MRTMNPHENIEEAIALLTLLRASRSAGALRALFETYGSAVLALRAGHAAWRSAGFTAKCCAAMLQPDTARIEHDLAWWRQSPRHTVLAWYDPDYPALLRYVDNPPAALFVAGDVNALWRPQIAVVGSRHASHVGKHTAQSFAERFVENGWCVTSGLAQGIDTFAHQGALSAGKSMPASTIAVVATGLDLTYPESNEALVQKIILHGAVVSEHPPGTPPLREHFPSRNRIIAGLSVGCVVIEAALRSGALITARLAGELGRDIFAVPGSIQNPMARGCHQLIRQGAALVEEAFEVNDVLRVSAEHMAEALRGDLRPLQAQTPLCPSEAGAVEPNGIYEALGDMPCTLDQLSERTGLTASELSSMLLVMEMEGRIAQQQGRYVRLI